MKIHKVLFIVKIKYAARLGVRPIADPYMLDHRWCDRSHITALETHDASVKRWSPILAECVLEDEGLRKS